MEWVGFETHYFGIFLAQLYYLLSKEIAIEREL
jgi:hypothetical protein